MSSWRLQIAAAVLVLLGIVFGFYVYLSMRFDPPLSTVNGANLTWHAGMNSHESVVSTHLSRQDAHTLVRLIDSGESEPDGNHSCPMDSGASVTTQFTTPLLSYPSFALKFDGCSGAHGHLMSDELRRFLAAHKPARR